MHDLLINLSLHLVPDPNPGHFIVSQLADLIGNHLVAGAVVITQVIPEQLPRVPESSGGVMESSAFYGMKSGHGSSLSHILYMGLATRNFKGSFRIPAMLWPHGLSH